MPTFMTSFTYTAEAWQKLAKNPEDRSTPLKALMKKLGGRLISLYYMAGDYDGVVIFEVPDAKAAATGIITASLGGHLRTFKTNQLFTVQEAQEIMGNAGQLAYTAPKG